VWRPIPVVQSVAPGAPSTLDGMRLQSDQGFGHAKQVNPVLKWQKQETKTWDDAVSCTGCETGHDAGDSGERRCVARSIPKQNLQPHIKENKT
jgi:hypothetical protein